MEIFKNPVEVAGESVGVHRFASDAVVVASVAYATPAMPIRHRMNPKIIIDFFTVPPLNTENLFPNIIGDRITKTALFRHIFHFFFQLIFDSLAFLFANFVFAPHVL